MTREKMGQMSDLFLKILMPICVAIISLFMNAAVSELRDLKKEIQTLHAETKQIQIDNAQRLSEIQIKLASVGIRLEEHERSARQ